jgi:hypothetical protein
MNAPLLAVFDFAAELPWTIPAIGVVVASFAFVMGRRLIASRPAPTPAPAAAPTGPPVDVFLHGSSRDRRAAPRRKGNNVEVFLAEAPDKEPIPGWVADRSVGGLCLMVERPVPEGAVWHVRPRSAPDSAPWTPIEVCSCRAENGEWEVGCRFVKTPQWNIMLLFG